MRRVFIVVVLATVAACGSSNNTTAPSAAKVTLSGTVKDGSGAAIANATVNVMDTQGNATTRGLDSPGHYTFANLTPATYQVWAAAPGYAIQSKILALTSDTVFDFTLVR
jgi:protocatechuate 3,4-dioxygenase beta subunit